MVWFGWGGLVSVFERVEHIRMRLGGIVWFEMFAWETRGKKVFKSFPEELFGQTKALAANQGLYNGFLAAGLIWTFFIQNVELICINVSILF